MNYHLLDDPERLHDTFRRRFTLPYGAFCHARAGWLSTLPEHYRQNYTQSYFDRLPYSDRLTPGFGVIPFSDALEELAKLGPVCFLTNPPGGLMHDYAVLGTEHLWAPRLWAENWRRPSGMTGSNNTNSGIRACMTPSPCSGPRSSPSPPICAAASSSPMKPMKQNSHRRGSACPIPRKFCNFPCISP